MEQEVIAGRNPVKEALRSGRAINKILIAQGQRRGALREIISQARTGGIIVQEVLPGKLAELAAGQHHQGVLALVAPTGYVPVADILRRAQTDGLAPLLLLLDEITDPHNLGAIIRTADATGVQGIVIPRRRAAPLTAAVAKASAGAVEYVPVARVNSIAHTMDELKKQGLWLYGADAAGTDDYYNIDWTGPAAIVVGSEGRGLSHLVRERCDFLVRIPMRGHLSSLNASVACSLILYEVLRQRERRGT